jgi:hypothetical protein
MEKNKSDSMGVKELDMCIIYVPVRRSEILCIVSLILLFTPFSSIGLGGQYT